MKEDGLRLSFSIEKDNFVINDTLSGKVVLNVHGNFTACNIEREDIINHLDNLQEALMSYQKSKPLFFKPRALSITDSIVIRENDHFCWTISHDGETAEIKDNRIDMTSHFDLDLLLKRINRVLAHVVSAESTLISKTSIIRRLSDVGMLIWKYKEHSAVVYEDNCNGTMMFDCLIDGMFYQYAVVFFNDDKTVSVYTNNYEEIMRVPLDESISYYFKAPQE